MVHNLLDGRVRAVRDAGDVACGNYAKTLRSALDGYVDYILATDSTGGEFEHEAVALETKGRFEPGIKYEQFRRSTDVLGDHR